MSRRMKDSGIEWIGEIPDDWEVCRIKKILVANEGGTWGEEPLSNDMNIIVLRSTEQGLNGNWNIQSPATRSFPCEFKYKLLKKGDLLLTKSSGSEAHIGKTSYVTKEVEELKCTYSNFMQRLSFDSCTNSKFYYYCFNNELIREQFIYLLTTTSGLNNINANQINNVIVPLPRLVDQTHIANYIDRKCDKIDETIEKQKQVIGKLKEYKQSIITEVVTKGLNLDVPIKESGIEWIGEIPDLWEIGKIKYSTKKIGSGKTPKGGSEVYSTEGILFIRSQNVYDRELRLDEISYISEVIDNEMQGTRVNYNDVLLNITGGSIGRSCIYLMKDEHANVNQHVCIIRTNQNIVLSRYMNYFWISQAGKTSIDIFQSGANREGMNYEQIANTYIPYLCIEEQNQICDYLDRKCSQIDDMLTKKETLIQKLTKYKKSLIYECVTGKREV